MASALSLGQSAPGVCVPALRTSRLYAVHCAVLSMYCRVSVVQEGGGGEVGQKKPKPFSVFLK